jgi:UV DNA damage repair endonuclease
MLTENRGPEENVLKHLALENDERIWTVAEIVRTASSLNIPARTDTLHHLNPGAHLEGGIRPLTSDLE